MRFGVLSSVVGVCVALAGCAASSLAAGSGPISPSSSPQQQWPEPRDGGILTAPATYNDGNITLNPPRAGDTATVPWREAYQHCSTGVVHCEPFKTGTIYLARATVINGIGDIQPDGSVKGWIVDRLVYALVYDPDECINFGPAPVADGSAAPDEPPSMPCTTISWIDASTGVGLGAQSWGVDIDDPKP